MAKYRCSVCGYIYDEQQEGAPFSGLKECPVCPQSADKFTLWQEETDIKKQPAGHIERDLAFCAYAEPDFITIDGRGGATGSSPQLLRDSASVPTIYALYLARKCLDSIQADISLVITCRLRVSSDFAKAIAMGAGAGAVASAPLTAMA